jgi:Tol biopolymer transport system component
MKRTVVALVAIATSLLSSVVGATPAGATYPGSNGLIAFSGDADGDMEIYVVAPDGGTPVQLTHNSVMDENPTFSPDGKLIYWDQELGSGKHVIKVMKVDGSSQKTLTSTKKDSWDPAPGPKGKVAFARTIKGNSEIFLMNNDGTGVAQLTDTGRYADGPAWSPDGKKLAFVRSYKFYSAVFIMTAQGRHKTAITPADADYYDPSFSPDGKRIAVDSDLTTMSDIYTMTTSGSDLVQVTSDAGRQILPQYSPDGLIVSYSDVQASTEVVVRPLSGGPATNVTLDSATDYNGGWQAT